MKALKATFPLPQKIKVSSTKPLTGHGLSLSSIMEAAFCCISLKDQFLPGSAHVSNPDPELGHLESHSGKPRSCSEPNYEQQQWLWWSKCQRGF